MDAGHLSLCLCHCFSLGLWNIWDRSSPALKSEVTRDFLLYVHVGFSLLPSFFPAGCKGFHLNSVPPFPALQSQNKISTDSEWWGEGYFVSGYKTLKSEDGKH